MYHGIRCVSARCLLGQVIVDLPWVGASFLRCSSYVHVHLQQNILEGSGRIWKESCSAQVSHRMEIPFMQLRTAIRWYTDWHW